MLEINSSKINNTVTFSVDRNSMKKLWTLLIKFRRKRKALKTHVEHEEIQPGAKVC
jgi:ribosomal protein S17